MPLDSISGLFALMWWEQISGRIFSAKWLKILAQGCEKELRKAEDVKFWVESNGSLARVVSNNFQRELTRHSINKHMSLLIAWTVQQQVNGFFIKQCPSCQALLDFSSSGEQLCFVVQMSSMDMISPSLGSS